MIGSEILESAKEYVKAVFVDEKDVNLQKMNIVDIFMNTFSIGIDNKGKARRQMIYRIVKCCRLPHMAISSPEWNQNKNKMDEAFKDILKMARPISKIPTTTSSLSNLKQLQIINLEDQQETHDEATATEEQLRPLWNGFLKQLVAINRSQILRLEIKIIADFPSCEDIGIVTRNNGNLSRTHNSVKDAYGVLAAETITYAVGLLLGNLGTVENEEEITRVTLANCLKRCHGPYPVILGQCFTKPQFPKPPPAPPNEYLLSKSDSFSSVAKADLADYQLKVKTSKKLLIFPADPTGLDPSYTNIASFDPTGIKPNRAGVLETERSHVTEIKFLCESGGLHWDPPKWSSGGQSFAEFYDTIFEPYAKTRIAQTPENIIGALSYVFQDNDDRRDYAEYFLNREVVVNGSNFKNQLLTMITLRLDYQNYKDYFGRMEDFQNAPSQLIETGENIIRYMRRIEHKFVAWKGKNWRDKKANHRKIIAKVFQGITEAAWQWKLTNDPKFDKWLDKDRYGMTYDDFKRDIEKEFYRRRIIFEYTGDLNREISISPDEGAISTTNDVISSCPKTIQTSSKNLDSDQHSDDVWFEIKCLRDLIELGKIEPIIKNASTAVKHHVLNRIERLGRNGARFGHIKAMVKNQLRQTRRKPQSKQKGWSIHQSRTSERAIEEFGGAPTEIIANPSHYAIRRLRNLQVVKEEDSNRFSDSANEIPEQQAVSQAVNAPTYEIRRLTTKKLACPLKDDKIPESESHSKNITNFLSNKPYKHPNQKLTRLLTWITLMMQTKPMTNYVSKSDSVENVRIKQEDWFTMRKKKLRKNKKTDPKGGNPHVFTDFIPNLRINSQCRTNCHAIARISKRYNGTLRNREQKMLKPKLHQRKCRRNYNHLENMSIEFFKCRKKARYKILRDILKDMIAYYPFKSINNTMNGKIHDVMAGTMKYKSFHKLNILAKKKLAKPQLGKTPNLIQTGISDSCWSWKDREISPN